MNERDKDKLIATRLLGFTHHTDADLGEWWSMPVNVPTETILAFGGMTFTAKTLPDFATGPAARLLEDEIERRGLQERYIQALDKVVTYERREGWEWFRWAILRATPAQRRDAALRAVGVEV